MKPKYFSDKLQKVGYDETVDLYRQVSRNVIANQSGLVRYFLDLFGPDLIGSLAFAIDPFKQFTNFRRKVSLLTDGGSIVRTRTPVTIQTFPRKEKVTEYTISRGYLPIPGTLPAKYYYTGPNRTVDLNLTIDRGAQPQVKGLIRDTTRQSRPVGFTGGEFELFIPKTSSASRSHAFKRRDTLVYQSISNGQRYSDESYVESIVTGPEFSCTNANVQLLLSGIRARATAHMQQNVLGMLDSVQPSHKSFDLFYQIAELRDLPRTLRGTLEVWKSFESSIGSDFFRTLLQTASSWRNPDLMRAYAHRLGHLTGYRFDESSTLIRNASSAYLTYKFGWESMVRGIVQMLPSPARVAKQVNFLVNHIGKDQSFRTKKTWIENEVSYPPFSNPQPYRREDFQDGTLRKSGLRKCELRLVANFTLQFPHVDVPKLRRELFLRRIGATPSPSDLYNLVPWTWLIDWFGGAGDYVQLMDTISQDRSLINNGYITYREVSEVDVGWTGKYVSTVNRNIEGSLVTTNSTELYHHTGRFSTTYQLRRSIPSLSNIRSYWDPDLGPSQLAIIGALLGSRHGSSARRDAS